MEHPLDDAYRKIQRAKLQLKQLDGEIRDGPLGTTGCEIALGVNTVTGDLLAKIPQPPILLREWSDAVGEVAHNLRSALDYAIFQLADGGEGHRTTFPIANGKRAYSKSRGKKRPSYRDQCLAGVPGKWARWIDQLQPFRSPVPEDKLRELSVLNSLSNRDKHRVSVQALTVLELPFCFLTIESGEFVKDLELQSSPDGRKVQIKQASRIPAKKGARLVSGIDPKVPPNNSCGSISVVFGSRRVSPENLWLVAGHIEFILGSLLSAFDPPVGTD